MAQHRLTDYIIGISAVQQLLETVSTLEVIGTTLVDKHGQINLCLSILQDSLDSAHKACLRDKIRPISLLIGKRRAIASRSERQPPRPLRAESIEGSCVRSSVKHCAGNAVRIVLTQFCQQVSHIDIADGGAGHSFHRQTVSASDIHSSCYITDAVALGVVITFWHISLHSRPADLQAGQVEGLSAEAPAHRLLSPVSEAGHTILDVLFC